MHVPGRLFYAADALSRAPVLERSPDEVEEEELRKEAEGYLHYITIPSLPATSQKLKKYRKAQMDDEEWQVREFCKTRWSSWQRTEAILGSHECNHGRRHSAIQRQNCHTFPLRNDALTRVIRECRSVVGEHASRCGGLES